MREPTAEAGEPTATVVDDCQPNTSAPSVEAEAAEAPAAAEDPPTEPVVEVAHVAPPTPAAAQPLAAPAKGLTMGPSISFDEDDAEEEDDLIAASSLTVDRLRDAWLRSAAEQPQRIQSVMRRGELHFDCPRLTVRVGSQLALNTLRNEAQGIRDIKSDLRCPELEITFELDEELAPPEAPKKVVQSPKEQYQAMLEVNPAIEVLAQANGVEV